MPRFLSKQARQRLFGWSGDDNVCGLGGNCAVRGNSNEVKKKMVTVESRSQAGLDKKFTSFSSFSNLVSRLVLIDPNQERDEKRQKTRVPRVDHKSVALAVSGLCVPLAN
jgi:hypothetical protein